MKKIYITLTILFFISSLHGQISINSSDMPSENDEYLVSNSLLLSFDEDATGTDYEWDYSDLLSISQDSMEFVAISDLSFIYQFIYNNPFDPENQATEGLKLNGIDLIPDIDIEDPMLFTKNSSSKIEEIGYGVTFSGLPFPVQYDDKKTLYEFPLAYGDSVSDSYAFSVTVPNLAYLGETGTRTYEVDGWGTLISPFGSFEVLRTRIESVFEDSIYIDSSDFGISIPRTVITYEWLAEDMGVPVLQITTEFGLVTSVVYQDSLQITTTIAEAKLELGDFIIYPQPAEDIVKIKLDQPYARPFSVFIYDLSGKEVIRETFSNSRLISINTSQLNAGIYMIEVNLEETRKVKKLIIR